MFFDTNILILYISKVLIQGQLDIVNKYIGLNKACISYIALLEVLAYSGYSDEEAKKV